MLDSPALQEVVHLGGVDSSCPLLILRRGLANPVVDVIGQFATCLVDLGRRMCTVAEALGPHSPLPPLCSVRSPMHMGPGPQIGPELWSQLCHRPSATGASGFPSETCSSPLAITWLDYGSPSDVHGPLFPQVMCMDHQKSVW